MFFVFLQLPQSTMTTTELRPGIYRFLWERQDMDPNALARNSKDDVTIAPAIVQPDPDQEVICRFLTTSIVCHSPALLMGNHPWYRARHHHHRAPLPGFSKVLPYLRRQSQGR